MTPSPRARHQRVSFALSRLLGNFLHDQPIGEAFCAPFDVVLRAEAPAIVLQPDLLFIAKGRGDIVAEENVQGAPDLVVEILSPSTARIDTVRKLGIYAAHGVREYWIVPHDHDRVEVLRLDGDTGHYGRPELFLPGDVLTSPLLPGFELPVTALFPPEASEP